MLSSPWGLKRVKRQSGACGVTFTKNCRERPRCRSPTWRHALPCTGSQHEKLHLTLNTAHTDVSIARSREQRKLSSCKYIWKLLSCRKTRKGRLIYSLCCLSDHCHSQQIVGIIRDEPLDVYQDSEHNAWQTQKNQKRLFWSRAIIDAEETEYTIGSNLKKITTFTAKMLKPP